MSGTLLQFLFQRSRPDTRQPFNMSTKQQAQLKFFCFLFFFFSPALQLLSSYGNEKTERVETDSTQLWDTEVTNLYTLVVYRYTV